MVDSLGCGTTALFTPPTRPPVRSKPKKEPSIELPGFVASPASSVERGGTYTSSAADRAVAAPTVQLKWLPEQGQADCVLVTVGAEKQEPAHTNTQTQTTAAGPTHPTPTTTNTPPAAAGPTSRGTAPAAPSHPQSHSWSPSSSGLQTASRVKLDPATPAERQLEWCPLLRLASGKSVLIAAPNGDLVGSFFLSLSSYSCSLTFAQSRSLPPGFVRLRSRSRARMRRHQWQTRSSG